MCKCVQPDTTLSLHGVRLSPRHLMKRNCTGKIQDANEKSAAAARMHYRLAQSDLHLSTIDAHILWR
jgi:hypothetical protein